MESKPMTEIDELLSRLRHLEPIALDSEFKASVERRARQRPRTKVRSARFASLAAIATGMRVFELGAALRERTLPLSRTGSRPALSVG